jgi:hypothetical protein
VFNVEGLGGFSPTANAKGFQSFSKEWAQGMGQLVWQGSLGQGLWAGVWGRLTLACSGLVSQGSLVPPSCGLKDGGARLSHVVGWFLGAVWCPLLVGLRRGAPDYRM